MKKFLLLASTFLFTAQVSAELCDFDLNRHERYKLLTERSQQAALVAAAVGSFSSGIVSILGSSYFMTGAALFNKSSNEAWNSYQECLVNAGRYNRLLQEVNSQKENQELEDRRRKDKERDKQESDKEKDEWEEDHENQQGFAAIDNKSLIQNQEIENLRLLLDDSSKIDKGPDKDFMNALELLEQWHKKMTDAASNPVKEVAEVVEESTVSTIEAPFRILGIKKPW